MPSYCTIVKANDDKKEDGDMEKDPTPDISVVIPAYNRNDIIEKTLESVIHSTGNITLEIIIVDDGSEISVEEGLKQSWLRQCRIIRQRNQGLLFARLAGLNAAKGRYVLFLDSDDFVSAEKLASHVRTMDANDLDISYTDSASIVVNDTEKRLSNHISPPDTEDSAYFFLRIQPSPHSPAYRREYLTKAIKESPLLPSKTYNPIAEIYFYFSCSLLPAVVGKSKGLAISCIHPGVRITNHWEPMGLAALAIMESFMSIAQNTPEFAKAKTYVAEAAFHTWRALPYDFPVVIRRRFKYVARQAPKDRLSKTGGKYFYYASRVLGPFRTGVILRRLRGAPYRSSQTLSANQLTKLIDDLE